MIDSGRLQILKEAEQRVGPVVYWMSRDQRVSDNWALIYAVQESNRLNTSLYVIFALTQNYSNANIRHYDFMLKGLKEVESSLNDYGIGFSLLKGDPVEQVPTFLNNVDASLLVSDFDPLRVKQKWKRDVSRSISIRHIEVDAHNIVPCWQASNKLEFAAYTLRPKINRLLPRFLVDFPDIPKLASRVNTESTDWELAIQWLKPSKGISPVSWIKSGEMAAGQCMTQFLSAALIGYSKSRNDPNLQGQSNLSPYFHYGQLSPQRVAIEVLKTDAPEDDKQAFLEELIVRRELSDNFCFYNPNYDNTSGFHDWAKKTHNEHSKDEREYVYTPEQFEKAKTHDPLWNAAQQELLKIGKMHGYMRMYWAKKILEWTSSVEEAMQVAILLNDKYSLDGRDPNGYAGIAWSIGGVHDRAWAERPVFGKVRYMNYNGCKRKFNVDKYISTWLDS